MPTASASMGECILRNLPATTLVILRPETSAATSIPAATRGRREAPEAVRRQLVSKYHEAKRRSMADAHGDRGRPLENDMLSKVALCGACVELT